MALKISPLVVQSARTLSGLTDSNYLYNNYLAEPEKLASVFTYQFGLSQNNIVNLLTGGLGNVLEIQQNEYYWDLYSRNDKSLNIVKNYGDGGATPGIQGTSFRVTMNADWFEVSDVLRGDKGTQVQVKDKTSDGDGYVYTLILTDPDVTKFINADEVAVGARFSKMYSAVGEFSLKGGSIITSIGFKLHNRLNILRKDWAISRTASQTVLTVDMFDPQSGKATRNWTTLAEWTAMAEFHVEVEKSLMYSIYNKNASNYDTNGGSNGRPVQMGAGLREQISPSNIRYYTELTYDLLDQFTLDLSYSATLWGGDKKFVALTGKMGMREFNRAISAKASGLNFIVVDKGQFISGNGTNLEFTGIFKTVQFNNGVELTVAEFPLYDDLEMNRELHPKTQKPIESYRFTILNVGQKNGKSNIRKVVRKGAAMGIWHTGGSIGMDGKIKTSLQTMGSSSRDGAEGHMISECGLMIEDPTSCGELILKIN